MTDNLMVELELTEDAVQSLIEVERELAAIAEELRGFVSDEELKHFTIEGWNSVAAKEILNRAQRLGYARRVFLLWRDLYTFHEPVLQLLTVVQSGVFVQGTKRFVKMEERDRAAFADLD